MSEHFSGKDYGDYFSQLERQLEKDDSPKPERRQEPERPVPVRVKTKTKRTLRPCVKRGLALFVIIGIVVAVISVITKVSQPKAGNVPDTSIPQSADTEKDDEPKAELFGKFTDNTQSIPADYESDHIYIVNLATNEVVAERRSTERAYPASTTKIMTLLVAVENIKDMSATFEMTYQITDPLFEEGATVAGFSAGEKINMTDLLYGVILPSGGDASIGLATHISGSEKEFVKLMNKKAKELGLKNTHFTNCTGLHDPDHYTTAEDLAVILRAAMQNMLCYEILSTYQHTTTPTKQHPEGLLLSSTLFEHMYGTEPEGADILGGKTGYVDESGNCIASFGQSEEDSTEYVCVTLNGHGRWPTYYDQINLYSAYAK